MPSIKSTWPVVRDCESQSPSQLEEHDCYHITDYAIHQLNVFLKHGLHTVHYNNYFSEKERNKENIIITVSY